MIDGRLLQCSMAVRENVMDLRQITYFMWVYEEGSFTRAAEKAGVVQPALSIQIKRLEEEFGLPLFERNSRGVAPTAHGRRFYELCSPIRRDIGFARSKMLELARPEAVIGRLRCGFPPTLYKSVIGGVVSRFLDTHPSVELELREGYGRTLSKWVSEGELDFALGAWSLDSPRVETSMMHEEEVVLVSGRALPLREFDSCGLDSLEGMNLMLPSATQILAPPLEQFIASGRLRPARIMRVDSYLGVMEIARAGDWAAFVPVSGISADTLQGGLRIYRVPRELLALTWHLIHPNDRSLQPGATAFIRLIEGALEERNRNFERLVEERRGAAAKSALSSV